MKRALEDNTSAPSPVASFLLWQSSTAENKDSFFWICTFGNKQKQ